MSSRPGSAPDSASSRAGRRAGRTRCEAFGYPVVSSRLPGPLMTRAWDLGLTRGGRGSDVVHSVSLAAPMPSPGTCLVVTVHDVAWRSMPEAYPKRGTALARGRPSSGSGDGPCFVVPSEATATAVLAAGVGISEDTVVVVPEGADHLGEPDEGGRPCPAGRPRVCGAPTC